jgi:multidomain signaling protein FimX
MLNTQDRARLLVVDASFDEAEKITHLLRNLGLTVQVLRVEEEALQKALTGKVWELAICAASLPELSITEVLRLLQQSEKDIPLIAMVEKETDSEAIDNLYRAGARDVVPRDRPFRLLCIAKRELEDLQYRRAYRRSERRVVESECRIRALLDSARDAVAYVYEGMHLYANPAYLRLFGCHGFDELESIPLLNIAAPEEHNRFKAFLKGYAQGEGKYAQFPLKVRKADGRVLVVTMEFTPISIEGEPCTQILIRDKVDDFALEEKSNRLQQKDSVTGLYNRHSFLELMEVAVSATRTGGDESSLFYLALDGFYRARERFGLAAGDKVIGEVGQILRRHCNESTCLARFGDEAFTLMVTQEQVDSLAERLRQGVEAHLVEVGRYTINVTCSIGICRMGENAPGVQTVLERAYKACLKAQAEGGNRIERYSPVAADLTEQEKIEQWEKRLRWSLSNDSFRLLYQPVVSLHGKVEEFFAVLLRLIDESGVYISLEAFLEPATQLELMGKIDRRVVGKAAQALQVQHQEGRATRFFTKLSPSSIHDPGLVLWLEELLQTTQLQANSLIFEISEDIALNYLKRARTLIQEVRR